MNNHKTENISIKTADVDINIIPVVNWINSFNWAYTRWSCEGNDGIEKPMIIFTCEDNLTLARILNAVDNIYGEITVHWYDFAGHIRYILRFNNKESLHNFIKDYLKC